MGTDERDILISNLNRLHTTDMGIVRIKRNLCLDAFDVVAWCRSKIEEIGSQVIRKGKNWYINVNECEITVNSHSYTIITAHKVK